MIAAEFGGAAPHRLSDYYRGGPLVPAGASSRIPTSGRIRLSDFYGAQREFVYDHNGDVTNMASLYDIFAANFPVNGGAVIFRFRNYGRIGSNDPARPALYVGDFPDGSTIIIENHGQILGASGRHNGGNGGGCIYSVYDNQTVQLYNYGTIYAGGGAGGRGGYGGGGYYQVSYTVEVQLGAGQGASTNAFGGSACTVSCTTPFGSSAWCAGNCR
jgi:hypothetical protein